MFVLERLPEFFVATRYWRSFLAKEPRGVIRRLLGRAMLFELNHLRLGNRASWPGGETATLYFDPLYVMRAVLTKRDIVVCHDVGPVTRPELFDRPTVELYHTADWKIQLAKPGIVFVSEASRADFVSHFGDRFRFLKSSASTSGPALTWAMARRPSSFKAPYLLTVAALRTKENHRRTIEAFARSMLYDRGYFYRLCGLRGNSAREVKALAHSTPGVYALGYRNDAELRWLYRNAAGFALPSLLEGFGLPAAEAGRHGLVSVICARGSGQSSGQGSNHGRPYFGCRHRRRNETGGQYDRRGAQQESRAGSTTGIGLVIRALHRQWAKLLSPRTSSPHEAAMTNLAGGAVAWAGGRARHFRELAPISPRGPTHVPEGVPVHSNRASCSAINGDFLALQPTRVVRCARKSRLARATRLCSATRDDCLASVSHVRFGRRPISSGRET